MRIHRQREVAALAQEERVFAARRQEQLPLPPAGRPRPGEGVVVCACKNRRPSEKSYLQRRNAEDSPIIALMAMLRAHFWAPCHSQESHRFYRAGIWRTSLRNTSGGMKAKWASCAADRRAIRTRSSFLMPDRLRYRLPLWYLLKLSRTSGRDLRDTCAREGGCVSTAGVAQLVEHLICNQRVGGSNPFASSSI